MVLELVILAGLVVLDMEALVVIGELAFADVVALCKSVDEKVLERLLLVVVVLEIFDNSQVPFDNRVLFEIPDAVRCVGVILCAADVRLPLSFWAGFWTGVL